MTQSGDRFPFGANSTPRPPRLAAGREAAVAVVGVYPSALHVRWDLPRWAVQRLCAPDRVGALAVDVEPTVFWDGIDPDPDELVARWKQDVGFVPGDDEGQHGHVQAVMNGTSGQAVVERVLQPLAVGAEQVFFTDVSTRFYVKSGSPARPQQADRIREVYEPFAREAGLPSARLPARPSPSRLVADAISTERDRLRRELQDAAAPTVVSLGEEARAVLQAVTDEPVGPPTQQLRQDNPAYGEPGSLRIDGYRAQWYALTHPGNRSSDWSRLQEHWAQRVGRSTK